jgi:hypothetical protein
MFIAFEPGRVSVEKAIQYRILRSISPRPRHWCLSQTPQVLIYEESGAGLASDEQIKVSK